MYTLLWVIIAWLVPIDAAIVVSWIDGWFQNHKAQKQGEEPMLSLEGYQPIDVEVMMDVLRGFDDHHAPSD